MVRFGLRQAVALLALFVAVLGVGVKPAYATHFRYGHMYWSRAPLADTPTTRGYTVTIETGWRWSFPWSPSTNPPVGTVVNVGSITITGTGFSTSVAFNPTVTSVNAAADLMYTSFEFPLSVPITAYPVTLAWQSNARLSTLLDGNNDQNFRLQTVIDASANTKSPRSVSLPIITLLQNQLNVIQLPSIIYDGLSKRVRFSTLGESGLVKASPDGMSIDSSGVVYFTPTVLGLYAVQFMIESLDVNGQVKSASPLDLLFSVVPGATGLTASISSPLTTVFTPAGGSSTTTVTSTLTPPTNGYTGVISNTTLPTNVTVTPAATRTGLAPFDYTVTHSPLANDPASVVCFQSAYTNNTTGLPVVSPNQLCITFKVQQPYSAPTVSCSAAQTLAAASAGGANATVNAAFTQSPANPNSTTLSLAWTVDGAPAGAVSIPGTESSGARTLSQLFSVGTHSVSAEVSDGTNTASCSTSVTVTQATTTLTTPVAGGPASVGTAVPLSSALTRTSPSAPLGGETVTFTIARQGGNVTTLSGTTDANGIASVSFTPSTAGIYSVTTSYAGSASYASSVSSALSLTATQPTALSTPTGMGASVGVPFTVTTRLTDSSGTTGISGRSVSFAITGASTQTKAAVTDATGLASTTFILSTPGAYFMTVTYTAAGLDLGSSAGPVPFTVAATATTALDPLSVATIEFVGDQVTATTSLTRVSAPVGPLAGKTVTFTLNTPGSPVVLSAVTDANGHAAAAVPAFTQRGSHSLTASFAGDPLNAPASTAPVAMTVYQKVALALPNVQGVAGAPTTVTATLTATPANTPLAGQTITFASAMGFVTAVTDASGVASASITFPAPGTFPVSASFSNVAGFFANANGALAAATTNATAVVSTAPTTLTTPVAGGPASVGTAVTLSSALSRTSPGAPLGGETVTFTIARQGGSVTTLSGTTDANGIASVSFTPSISGFYTVTSSFAGSAAYAASVSSALSFAAQQPTALSTPTGMGASVGVPFTVTTRLTDSSGTGIVGRSVSFAITGTGLQTRVATTDATGLASATFIVSIPGPYAMTVTYAGAGLDIGSSAGPVPFTVDATATTALSAPTPAPIAFVGEALIATSTLSRTSAPSAPLAGKTVAFTLTTPGSPVVVNAGTDANGHATATFPAYTQRGNHSLTASFAGDPLNAPASTAPVAMTVYQRVALALPNVQGVAGAPTTVTATLTATPANTPLAGQTVTFASAQGFVNAVTNASGVASVSITFPTSGTFPVSANFSNLAGFFANANGALAGSTASATADILQPTQLALAPATGVAGAPVTLSATLTGTGGAPIAGQVVTFDTGGVTPSTTAVTGVNGVAAVNLTFAAAGAYTVTASFDAQPAYVGSTTSQQVTITAAAASLSALTFNSTGIVGVSVPVTTTLERVSAPAGPLAGQTVTFTLTTPSAAQVQLLGQTDANGNATVTFPAPVARGTYALSASYAGDATNAPTSIGPATLTVYQRTSVSAPSIHGVAGTPATFTAELRALPSNAPVQGQTITFTSVAGLVSAVTDANGVASASVTFPNAGSFPFTASFSNVAGFFVDQNGSMLPSTAEGTAVMDQPDSTPPVITPTVTGTLSNGWYTSDVSISFVVTDPESTIDSTSGCEAASVTSDGASFSFTCTASSRGGTNSQTVTVKRDTTAPQLTVPAAQTAEATSAQGAVVSFAAATAVDQTSGVAALACVPASGSTFAIGATTVVCTATDVAGNSTSGSFSVTVSDTTAPSLALPSNITVHAALGTGSVVTYSASALDIVDGVRPVSCVPASGSVFPIGVTTVNCSTSDAHGNPAQGSFLVSVTNALPSAVANSYTTDANGTLTVTAPGVLGNDSDADNDPLTALVATAPAHGTLTLNANGGLSYTPAANYAGGDSFTYRANDGRQDSLPATVTLTVLSPTSIFAQVKAVLVSIDPKLANDADKIIEKKFEKGCEEAGKLSRSIAKDNHYTAAQKATMIAALARLTQSLGCVVSSY